MNKLFTISIVLILVLFSTQLVAQQASRFPIQPTSVWRINYEYSCMSEEFVHESGDSEYKYFVNGDTLINAKTYYKLYKSGVLYLESPVEFSNKYMGAIRDSADRFFYVEEKSASERLLYNFAANIEDPICPDCDGMDYRVSYIDTLSDGRKVFYIDVMTVHCGSANRLVEGIGWLGGLLEGNACYSHPGIRGSYLLCYSENGVPVYETENSRCGKAIACNSDFTSVKMPFQLFTPEVSVLPGGLLDICMPDGFNNQYNVEIFNILGKRVQQVTAELPGTIEAASIGKGTFLIRISNGQYSYSIKVANLNLY